MKLLRKRILGIGIAIAITISVFFSACSQPVNENALNGGQISGEQIAYSHLDDELARQYMYELVNWEHDEHKSIIKQVLEARDDRFIIVFIELLRSNEIGITNTYGLLSALKTLTGENIRDWLEWVEWYGNNDFQPPPGFLGWKGSIYRRIDLAFELFLKDGNPTTINVEEIQWGGVKLDSIPALDNPKMLPVDEAIYLEPGDAVFGISLKGDSRAYPLRIMDWHEMANDVIGGIPVSLSYCTLCGAAIAYDGRVPDGGIYTFGSSGFLYRSNKLMYDRQTFSLWNQFTGEPVLGELAGKNIKLDLLPVVLTTWEEWKSQHPETVVLDLDTGYSRPYSTGAAYAEYFSSEETMFPVWQRSDLLEAKSQIYALNINGIPKAYPIDILAEEKIVNDELGGVSIVLVATRGLINLNTDDIEYTAGIEVRVYDRGERRFGPEYGANTISDGTGQDWRITEEALIGPNGEEANRINGHLAYWFGWFAFFPHTLVYGN